MRKKRFRPIQEELKGPLLSGVFCVIWYVPLLGQVYGGGFSVNLMVFLLAGIFPLYGAVTGAGRALFYRRQRKQAVNRGNKRPGKIVNIIRTLERRTGSTRSRSGSCYCYYLEVEITDPVTGVPNIIRSDAYREPIDRYLGSPYVQVYEDDTGWRYFLEDFQMKEHAWDPDIFPGAREYREPLWGRRILQILFVLLFVGIVLYNLVVYGLQYAVNTVDESESPDGKYTLLLQSVGTPVFFSSADGRLVLKEGKKKIAVREFTLSDDGGAVRKDIWQVSWGENYVYAVISGDEQNDELIEMYYNGDTDTQQLGTQWGRLPGEQEDSDSEAAGEQEDSGNGTAGENTGRAEEEKSIYEGYRAIYEKFFKEKNDSYIEDYSAKGDSRIILHEDTDEVEYLVYDRESKNGKCGLYVYYRAGKDEAGSWSSADAEILDMYAYVYDSGEVISSGKTTWSDTGTKEYADAAGEP